MTKVFVLANMFGVACCAASFTMSSDPTLNYLNCFFMGAGINGALYAWAARTG